MPHLHFLYRCRKLLLELKRKKEEYDKLMDKLQKDVRDIHVHFMCSVVGLDLDPDSESQQYRSLSH